MKDYSKPGSRCAKTWKAEEDRKQKEAANRAKEIADACMDLCRVLDGITIKRRPWWRRLL